MAITISAPKVLVVEGREDEVFFSALIHHLGLQQIQLIPVGDKQRIRAQLKAITLDRGFRDVVALGIVRDADSDPSGAFQSVRDALRDANLPVPEQVLIPAGEKPKVTVMILPKPNAHGMLEDLCLESIGRDPAMACVDEYFECLHKHGIPSSANISKARVHTFLASRQEAGLRLGEAAQKGYWPWNSEAFEPVKEFLIKISPR